MHRFPANLEKRLQNRISKSALRKLGNITFLTDFSSNDYLGFSRNQEIFEKAHQILQENDLVRNGSGGSRLLTGNNPIYAPAEEFIAAFHCAEAALIFNSGFDANLGFFGCVPQRHDVIFFDEYSHASIRDGIALSKASAFKFRHNDLDDLKKKIDQIVENGSPNNVYIVTEAVFSMDGDIPNLKVIAEFSKVNGYYLVLDEAHATGVIGQKGKGMVEELGLQDLIFARILTFGKAIGAHGAAILGSAKLKEYLVNFARSLIYTTALPPHSLATVLAAYEHLQEEGFSEVKKLQQNIAFFNTEIERNLLQQHFIQSKSSIHCCVVPGNERVKQIALDLQNAGFDVKPIMSPTVPEGKERLRFCLHSFNSKEEIFEVLKLLTTLLK